MGCQPRGEWCKYDYRAQLIAPSFPYGILCNGEVVMGVLECPCVLSGAQ